jgi:hypothetical protein
MYIYVHNKVYFKNMFESLSFFKCMEYRSTSLATRYNTTVHNVGVDSLTNTTIHFKDLHERWDDPNMPESNVGKFTSPFSSDTDSIKCGHDDVAQSLPQFETFVWQFPYTVKTVYSVWFSKYIVEMQSLKYDKKIYY